MKQHLYFVYILASKSRVLYTGVTNSVASRTKQHRASDDGFTHQYRVWRLVHYERFQYVGNAIRREKQIKKMSRAHKIRLIEETNPTWEDLSLVFGSPVQLGHCTPRTFGSKTEQKVPASDSRPPLDDKGK